MTVQDQSGSLKDLTNTDNISLIIAEYSALREEILKLTEIEHQLFTLALIALGTILTIGLQTRNASIILMYPVLALFLSVIWAGYATSIIEIGKYIRDQIESRVGENNIGWQHYLDSRGYEKFYAASLVGPGALFIGTELIAILAGIIVAKFDITEIVLFIVVVLSIILTLAIIATTPQTQIISKIRKRI